MKFRHISPDLQIPMLAFGTWRLGGIRHPDTSRDSETVQALQTAIAMGYTHIDTAEMYGGGHTEELVGLAIQEFKREQLQVCTKVWQTNLRYHDLLRAVQGSLKRLQTDYVDFYAIHLPSAHVPLAETFRALNELVDSGVIRHLAVSNFTVDQLKLAERYSKTSIRISQAPCSLYNRKYIKGGLLSYCQERDMLMGSYSPFEHGLLFDHPLLQQIAERHSASPAQVALAWILHQPSTMVYLMSTKEAHLKDNLDALDLKLSDEESKQLDELEMPEERLWPE
jgi:diketogulonate reductase-like aldo/keto reductase